MTTIAASEVQQVVISVLSYLKDAPLEAAIVDDLEASSIDILEIQLSLEEAFGIRLNDDDIFSISTVGQLVDLVRRAGDIALQNSWSNRRELRRLAIQAEILPLTTLETFDADT